MTDYLPHRRTAINILIFGGAVILFCSLYECHCGLPPAVRVVSETKIERDTVFEQIPGDTVVVYQARPSKIITRDREVIVYADTVYSDTGIDRIDTVLIAEAFDAELDTILGSDTLFTAFRFPPPRFDVDLRQGPDSIRTIVQTITITQPDPWYAKAGWAGFGAAVSLLGVGIYSLSQSE